MPEFWEVVSLSHMLRAKNGIVVFLNLIWHAKSTVTEGSFFHLKKNKWNIWRISSCLSFLSYFNKNLKPFHLEIRKKFFIVRTINQWNSLPRDIVECPSLIVFRMWFNVVLDNLIDAPFPTKDWTRWAFKFPSHLGCSMIHLIHLIRQKFLKKKGKKRGTTSLVLRDLTTNHKAAKMSTIF